MVNHNVNHKNIELINSLKNKEKIKILFVCLGNICRSPAAECIMKMKLEKLGYAENEVRIDSAGIGSWHEGQLPDRRMRSHGCDRGYDISSRARQIRREDFDRFDFIIGMDHENVADLMSLARTPEDRKKILRMADFFTRHKDFDTVPDPYYGGDRGFELVLDMLEDACDGVIDRLWR